MRNLILIMPLFHGVENRGECCESNSLLEGRDPAHEASKAAQKQKSKKTYKTTMRDPRRAEHAFSPPLSVGKLEGTAVLFPLLEISAFDMHFLFS
jgi:hypothetical protein